MHTHFSFPRFVLTTLLIGSTAFLSRGQSKYLTDDPSETSRKILREGARPHISGISPDQWPGNASVGKAAASLIPDYRTFSTDYIRPLSAQSPAKFYSFPAVLAAENGDIYVAFKERAWVTKIWITRSTDGGETWQDAVKVAEGGPYSLNWLTLTRTTTGRLLIADETMFSGNHLYYSDDEGNTWSEAPIDDIVVTRREDWPGRCGWPDRNDWWLDGPGFNTEPVVGPVGDEVWHVYSDLENGTVNYFASEDGLEWSESAGTMVENPDANTSYLYLQSIVEVGEDSLLASFMKVTLDGMCYPSTALSRSFDRGVTWSPPEPLHTGGIASALGQLARSNDGTIWHLFQDTYFDLYMTNDRLPKSDLFYSSSSDGGNTWSAPEPFTRFAGMDLQPRIAATSEGAFVAFVSNRFIPGDYTNAYEDQYSFGGTRIWIGALPDGGETTNTAPPIIEFREAFHKRYVTPEEDAAVLASVSDETGLARVWLEHTTPSGGLREIDLKNDATGQIFPDEFRAEDVWAGSIGSVALGEVVDYKVWAEDLEGNRAYSDRSRWQGWPSELLPTQFFSQPRHDVGAVCLNLTSAVQNTNYPPSLQRQTPRSGFLGAYPINSAFYVIGALTWPCPDGPSYLYEGSFFVAFRSVNGHEDVRVLGYRNEIGWSEIAKPVAYSGWSDQDFSVRYEDTGGYGVVVKQESHQFAGQGLEDAVFLEYTVYNTGSAGTLEDLELALYLDPDVGFRTDDLVEYDPGQQVLYLYDDGQDEGCDCGPGTVAMAPVSDHDLAFVNVAGPNGGDWDIGIDPDLAAGDPIGPADVRGTIGIAVETLSPGDSAKVAFVVIMAENRNEVLLTKLPLARSTYQERSATTANIPPAARIISPPAYSEIWAGPPDGTVENPELLPNTEFVWEPLGKTGGQSVSYDLQLDAYSDFLAPIETSAGTATEITGPFEESVVVARLVDLEVEPSENRMFYARVVASNGERTTYGPLLPLSIRMSTALAIDETFGIPDRYALYANYPNPFNPSTTIRFDLPASGHVSLRVFDLLGREVARLEDGLLSAGRHVYHWDASGIASGMYLYRLTAGGFVADKTLVLVK